MDKSLTEMVHYTTLYYNQYWINTHLSRSGKYPTRENFHGLMKQLQQRLRLRRRLENRWRKNRTSDDYTNFY